MGVVAEGVGTVVLVAMAVGEDGTAGLVTTAVGDAGTAGVVAVAGV
ncbi:MAG: hypothetical protein ACQSGP_06080 [Frankia sp.]